MPTGYQKKLFSGSTDGRPIPIGTNSAGQLIHTAPSSGEGIDEIAVFGYNTTTAAIGLHLQWGGTASAEQLIVEVPPQSAYIAAPSLPLTDGLSLRAFASADGVNLQGYVNRITSLPGGGVSKGLLSNSTSGVPILLSQTASPGNVIHTATSDPNTMEEVWLYAYNPNSANALLTLEWGGNSSGDQLVYLVEPFKPFRIAPGLLLQNRLEIRCFSNQANVSIVGFVNRIRG